MITRFWIEQASIRRRMNRSTMTIEESSEFDMDFCMGNNASPPGEEDCCIIEQPFSEVASSFSGIRI